MNKQNLVDLIFQTQTSQMSVSRCAEIILENMSPKTKLEKTLDRKAKAPKGNFASKLN